MVTWSGIARSEGAVTQRNKLQVHRDTDPTGDRRVERVALALEDRHRGADASQCVGATMPKVPAVWAVS
jgi:hypothetical protein